MRLAVDFWAGGTLKLKLRALAAIVWIGLFAEVRAQVEQPSFLAERVLPSNSGIPSPLSSGKLFSIYGEGLGHGVGCIGKPSGLAGYPTVLCKVQVFIGDEAAELLFVQEKQINFKVPSKLPAQGTVLVRVIFDGTSSPAVAVAVGYPRTNISLEGVGRVGGPVWLRVHLPAELGEVAYPGGNPPMDFGCNQVEVRQNGALLAKRVMSSLQGAVGPSNGCGNDLTYPGATRPHSGRLPIHLQYQFYQPGSYEARYTRLRSIFDQQIVAQSGWTKIELLPEAPRPPQIAPEEVAELLSEYLPSILVSAGEETLSALIGFLYHPDVAVRQYAAAALGWWPKEALDGKVREAIRKQGPSDVLMAWYSTRLGPEFIDPLVPYLQSRNPVLLKGALIGLNWLLRTHRSNMGAGLATRTDAAVLKAAEQVIKQGDPETSGRLVEVISAIPDPRAGELLWSLVRRGIARGQAVIAISWRKDVKDLAPLGELLIAPATDNAQQLEFSSLPYALHNAFGSSAYPFLEACLQKSGHIFVRVACARELVRAGRGSGFSFIVEAIEKNRSYRQEVTQFVRDQFLEVRGRDDATLLIFLKQRIQ